jgi:ppGpp synthetase/RelA/SpoT-type nucleotidyltranferase
MADKPEAMPKFDFNAHRESAIVEYTKNRPLYEDIAQTAKKMITVILRDKHVRYQSIEARAKEIDEFGKKAAKPLESDPTKPKYPNPLNNITDMAGVRVITFLPRTVEDVCKLIEQNFEVLEKVDKAAKSMDEGKIGYQSVHYLVKMHLSQAQLSEYKSYKDLTLEIQVRTMLQHAWAEMEHDIQYKSIVKIPTLIKRRFIALAGLLDIADREFQTLNDEYEQKKQQQENDLEIYIRNLLESPERDYIVESLKELVLWIDSPKFREELLKKQSELMAKKIDVDKFIEDSMSEIRSDGKYKN